MTTSISWLAEAERHRADAQEFHDRLQRARVAGGRATGGGEAARAVSAALDIAAAKRVRWRDGFHAAATMPILSDKIPSRVIPGDHVSLRAETMLGIEAELAAALEEVARLKADRAEEMARRREIAIAGGGF